jgi:hypothetical protein
MQACTNIDIGVIAGESIRTTVAGGFVRSRRDSASNADRDGDVTSAVLGAEKAVHAATEMTAEALEILCRRHPRARLLGRPHARLRGSNPRQGDAASTLVRGASGQQVVHRAHSRCRESVDLSYPKIDAAKENEVVAARAALARER